MEQINWISVIIVLSVIITMMILVDYLYKKNLISLKTVHAGSGNRRTYRDDSTNVKLSLFDTFYHKGKQVYPKDYEVRIVEGDCLEERGITNGNILFIKRFAEGEDKKAIIKTGDILFINKIKDGKVFYKIREFEKYNTEGELLTFSYENDGSRRPSSSSHDIGRIDGVVKMRFEK
jgi:hypothetical protein